MEFFFCRTLTTRSNPIPVSTCFCGRSCSLPFSSRLYWIKTRFHSSITSSIPALTSSALQPPSVRSMCISEHGPQGPVSPISQKLSFSSNFNTCDGSISVSDFHRLYASSSSLYTVAHNLALGIFQTSVNNSQAQLIASFL